MDYYFLALRLAHIVGGVTWAGTAIVLALFVSPTVNALGADGGRFMQHMFTGTSYLKIVPLAAVLTLVSGVLMFMRLAGAPGYAASLQGMVLGAGAVAGIAGWLVGVAVAKPTSERMAAIGQAAAAAGGPPSAEQIAELGRLKARMGLAGNGIAGLLTVSIALMAIARYVY